MRHTRVLLAASLLAGAVLAAPSAPGQLGRAFGAPDFLDYEEVQRTLPEMKRLSDASSVTVKTLHEHVDELGEPHSKAEQAEIREKIRAVVEEHLATKTETAALMKKVLRMKPSGLSEEEVFKRVHDMELTGINWDDVTFRKSIRDLSRAMGVPIRMQHSVVQMNRVTMRFRRAKAATILGSLCNFFHLRYVIYDGEIVLYKKITPTEDRFLEYQKKHPNVKLRYWDREDASGAYKKEEKE